MAKVGRPLKFETDKELQEAIDKYFLSNPEKPTVTGLAYELGFEDRSSIYNYKERDEFSYTIKRAILRIESRHEEKLYESAAAGSIFWLKNRGWKDNIGVEDTTQSEFLKFLESQRH